MAKHTILVTYKCASTHTHTEIHTHRVGAGCPQFLMGSDSSAADTQTASVSQTWKSEGRRMEECQRKKCRLIVWTGQSFQSVKCFRKVTVMCNYTTASLITSLTMQRKYIILEPSGGRLKCDCSVSKGFVCWYFHCLYLKFIYQQCVASWIIQDCGSSRITDVDSGISKWKVSCTTPETPFRFYVKILMSAGLPAVPLADAVCWRLLSCVFLRLTAILIDTPPA